MSNLLPERYSYATCHSASIQAQSQASYSGTLLAKGRLFRVSIKDNRLIDRKMASVRVDITLVEAGKIDDAKSHALKLANAALTNPSFEPVRVNLFDGETLYARRWTHDYPSALELDAFFDKARYLIEKHADVLGI